MWIKMWTAFNHLSDNTHGAGFSWKSKCWYRWERGNIALHQETYYCSKTNIFTEGTGDIQTEKTPRGGDTITPTQPLLSSFDHNIPRHPLMFFSHTATQKAEARLERRVQTFSDGKLFLTTCSCVERSQLHVFLSRWAPALAAQALWTQSSPRD